MLKPKSKKLSKHVKSNTWMQLFQCSKWAFSRPYILFESGGGCRILWDCTEIDRWSSQDESSLVIMVTNDIQNEENHMENYSNLTAYCHQIDNRWIPWVYRPIRQYSRVLEASIKIDIDSYIRFRLHVIQTIDRSQKIN